VRYAGSSLFLAVRAGPSHDVVLEAGRGKWLSFFPIHLTVLHTLAERATYLDGHLLMAAHPNQSFVYFFTLKGTNEMR